MYDYGSANSFLSFLVYVLILPYPTASPLDTIQCFSCILFFCFVFVVWSKIVLNFIICDYGTGNLFVSFFVYMLIQYITVQCLDTILLLYIGHVKKIYNRFSLSNYDRISFFFALGCIYWFKASTVRISYLIMCMVFVSTLGNSILFGQKQDGWLSCFLFNLF